MFFIENSERVSGQKDLNWYIFLVWKTAHHPIIFLLVTNEPQLMIWLVLMVIVRMRRQGYERFLSNCKGAMNVVTGGKRLKKRKVCNVTYTHCNALYLARYSAQAEKICLRFVNTTLPLTEWTICKVFPLVNSSQLPHILLC